MPVGHIRERTTGHIKGCRKGILRVFLPFNILPLQIFQLSLSLTSAGKTESMHQVPEASETAFTEV